MLPAQCAEPDSVVGTTSAALRSRVLALGQQWSRQRYDAALLFCFAVFATSYALITRNLPHQMWALYAAGSYALGEEQHCRHTGSRSAESVSDRVRASA